MTNTIRFGLVAGVALAASVIAGEKGSEEKGVRRAPRASVQARMGPSTTDQRPSSATIVPSSYGPMKARGASASSGVRAFDQERWLVEREGYRDGGY